MRVLGKHHEGHEQQGSEQSKQHIEYWFVTGLSCCAQSQGKRGNGYGMVGRFNATYLSFCLSEGSGALHRRRRQALESHAVVVCPSSSGDRHSKQTLPLSTPEEGQGTPAILDVWADGLQPDNRPKEKGDELAKCVLLTPRVTIQTNPTGQSVLKTTPAPAPSPVPLIP